MKTVGKKTLLYSFNLLFSCVVAAQTPHINQTKSAFAGFNAGAGVGSLFSQYKTNSENSLLSPSTAFFANSQNSADNSSANVLGTFFIGYLFPINPFYIGPEIYINMGKPGFSSAQSASAILPTESLTTNTNGHYNTAEFGIDLRLGLSATPTTLIYGLIGAAFNKLSMNTASSISRPALPLTTTTNNSASFSEVGLRLGAGLEQKITPNINVRINYIYTTYPSHSSSHATAPNPADPFFQLGPIANTTSVSGHNQAIFASIVYQLNDHFAG